MAMTENSPHGRPGRRRPFSTFMKKLANLSGVSSGEGGRHANSKRSQKTNLKTRPSKNNNPYPLSGRIGNGGPIHHRSRSFSETHSGPTSSASSLSRSRSSSIRSSVDGRPPPTTGGRSMAPTVSTDHETSRSITAPSHGTSSLAGTGRTANMESRRGGDSTFSSPAPSVRSLTTTLTTIQSMAPNGMGNVQGGTTHGHGAHQNNNLQAIQFNQPFPTTSPASAIPAHLTPSGGHPTTYATATANNLLTDNASILTLASSSKRRRRRSLDTDASVRALAPSSLFGGSRESLPLSVLSANVDGATSAGGAPTTPGLHQQSSRMGAGERASIYSATGILASERNSLYAKQTSGGGGLRDAGDRGDGASVRSGLLGHGRADSISGSIGGLTSPLSSPREELERGRDYEKSGGVDERDEDAVPENE